MKVRCALTINYIQYEKKHKDFLKKTKKIKNGRKQNEKYKNFLTRKNLKNYAIGKNIRKQEPEDGLKRPKDERWKSSQNIFLNFN